MLKKRTGALLQRTSWILIFVLLLTACAKQAQEPERRTPEGEAHVRAVIQNLPSDSRMRKNLEDGARGNGIPQPWMEAMRKQGVKRAEVYLAFNVPIRIPHIWPGRPGKLTVVRTLYFSKYDSHDCAQITDPDRLAAFHTSGLEQKLQSFALEEAADAKWFVFEHVPSVSHGESDVELFDDEWLPRMRTFLHGPHSPEEPLVNAAEFHDEVEVNKMLAAHSASQKTLNVALMIAAYNFDSCIVQSLLKAGADVDYRNELGKTPLMYAAETGIARNVRILLGAGAKADIRSNNGDTALTLAQLYRRSEIVPLLDHLEKRN